MILSKNPVHTKTDKVTSDFGRKIDMDLSTRQNEFKLKMFPLNIILDSSEEQDRQNEYYAYPVFWTAQIRNRFKN